MKYFNDASEAVVKSIAEVDRIRHSLGVLLDLGDALDHATYCSDAARWLGVKAILQRRISWTREALFTEREAVKLLADQVFQPDECAEPRCFVRPGVEHSHPAPGVTFMGDQ